MPGDSIVVKEKPGVVNIIGEVYNPGLIEFVENKSLDYYLDAVGGLAPNGNKKGIIIINPNGVVSPVKRFRRETIDDGSTIVVNQKPPSEPFNPTAFATNWASIISSMVTAIVLSRQL